MKKTLEATGLLVGTIIGAGIFGIPYVMAQAGFLTGLLTIGVLGVVVIILYLYLGEVTLRTKGRHQLTGYAKIYLGKYGKIIMSISMISGIVGALIAYLFGIGQALSAIFGGNPWIYSLIFFIGFAAAIYYGIKTVAKIEFWILPALIIIIALFALFSFKKIDISNLSGFYPHLFFVPYGVILFSLLGMAVIPEMRQHLYMQCKKFKRALIIGIIIPIAVYIIFALIVIGVTGLATTEIATIGLGNALGYHMIILGNLFAVFTMVTSFLTLGLAGKQMFQFDFKMHKSISWALIMFIPLLIALSGLTSFIKAIGIAGTIAGTGEGILIVLMHYKAKKLGKRNPEYSIKSNYIIYTLVILLFVVGTAWFIYHLF